MANVMKSEKRAQIARCLVDGNSIAATCRIVGVWKQAVLRLLERLGPACHDYQARMLRELPCKRIQADEIWSFIGCKEGHLPKGKERAASRGDCWVWTALDPDTKLMVAWHVGRRESKDALLFMADLASRLKDRVQISTDGLPHYADAVEQAFGSDADLGQVIKIFGVEGEASRMEARYSPPKCTDVRYNSVLGNPDPDHICTSHNERHNLTIRMNNRRFTRLTNAFSKKLENHRHSIDLQFMHYNFCRIHQSIRCTPAQEAGVADHIWTIEEVVALIDQ